MLKFVLLFALASLVPGFVKAQSPVYGQCGGQGWTGATSCASGSTCVYSNQYYSQCLPGGGGGTTAPPVTTPKPPSTSTAAPPSSTGFVTRSGTKFMLNGKQFYFTGTNAYWATSLSSTDLDSLFSQMSSAGLKVLRIFGWCDNVGSPQNTCFQSWSGTTNTPNANAFAAHMDPIVNAAQAHGIKLVVPMIGNWGPSISLYIQQFLGSSATHDTFYSNTQIINAYKKYINFFVSRYKNSPAIFAWELMNEPRCTGDDNRGASSACNNQLITNWVSTISSYIKSIDSNHMVTVGDEGWFTPSQGYGTSYPYSGSIGIDWVTNLKISSIDYGTVHLYPDSWGQSLAWGNTWIQQHGAQASAVGKPVVLEEFGTTNTGSRASTLQGWLNQAVSSSYGGIQYWQFVSSFPSGYKSPDDGNGISTTESSFSIIKSNAATQNAK
ncbi:hypothetical protein GALMADRAFT_155465 [Galerina marginata CBS 339.88]|uniref:mannan endo-1,4-beta-mannosidase n=1 Tax=Galerina marginata (strain CBS 339.88) TaxID=685588 RepID=A0A067TCK3_GALM3|nr:hypothetical protein GALMADRAFT_155465 [Galerina marginata CBS 339.88]